jgi:hypothetical protein
MLQAANEIQTAFVITFEMSANDQINIKVESVAATSITLTFSKKTYSYTY